jgi:hypothetical protein
LRLAIAQYHDEKEANLKPNILSIAGKFEISKSTLYRHIRNQELNDHDSKVDDQLLRTSHEEKGLADRAEFMDHWNISSAKEDFYELAKIVLEQKGSDKYPGRDWIYGLMERNPRVRYCFASRLKKDRANANNWHVNGK